MFNSDFYPTPNDVISKMIEGYDLTGKIILEPSAGKGNIIDYISQMYPQDVITCEIEEDLQKILKEKSTFLTDDFLTVKSDQISHVDFIIMNPPFSNAAEHIYHAWDIAPAGCKILALCNTDSIDSDMPTRKWRHVKQLAKENGLKTNLGSCFQNSERHTNVEVSLVTLFKPGVKEDWGDYFDMGEDEWEDNKTAGLMHYNAVREVVQRYVGACKIYDEVIELGVKMNYTAGDLGVADITFVCTYDKAQKTKLEFVKELQKKSWKTIINKMNLGKYLTKSLKEDINKFVETQQKFPFTMKNVYKMLELIAFTHEERMNKVMLEVFDNLTKHYKDNRHNVEGWKTNDHYFIGEKFILPYVFDVGFSGGMDMTYGRRNAELVDDFVKALCYLTGEPYDPIYDTLYQWTNPRYKTIYEHDHPKYEYGERVYEHDKPEFGKWKEFKFFEIKGYKKGTMHAKFKDRDLWARFNQKIGALRGYPLPENIKL